MKAVIHIGAKKTGTTTIQGFLAHNREELRKQGIFYPTCDEHVKSRYLQSRWGEYRREIEANCGKDDLVIFSDENLSLSHSYKVWLLKKLTGSLFDDVVVILYLRRQPEFMVSLYNTGVRSGNKKSFAECLDDPKRKTRLAYHSIVKCWQIFGKDKLRIRVFDKEEFHDKDLLSDFAHTVGFDTAGLERVKDANISLDSALTEFLRLLNAHVPVRLALGKPNPLHRMVRCAMESAGGCGAGVRTNQKAYQLDRNEAQRILDQFRNGNDWIAREHLGREKLFNEDVSMYPEEVADPHHLTLERSVEISAQILKCFVSLNQADIDKLPSKSKGLAKIWRDINKTFRRMFGVK